jgi:hypothetical protein
MDTLLFYIAVGIFINLFADMLVSYLDAEDLRLTMIERIIVLIICWND